ncbi:thermonuclease family protein [Pontixanthobacter gangjinensis]|uniref:TNase-like domain-containing protein n=1 Tax=Pontixanthobacter gangjinensis TaxID=1028742 RepID=A0A6I4SPP1_9SPHN|nr:thermonuclease family protein [Pontixanthobacter gangjinensis]MXO57783.1 hypothetical protein [Pontixanthobacter gangjinensis]
MKTYLILAVLILTASGPAVATESVISGTATAADGDTLNFSGASVRLLGIDAPELKQSCIRDSQDWQCGREAAAMLAQLIEGQNLKCQSRGADEFGNLLASCTSGDLDLGLTMVEAGLAVALASGGHQYAAAEALRKTHRIGIWSSQFDHPADWRLKYPAPKPKPAERRASVRSDPAPSANTARSYRNQFGCAIKGNRNRRGQWIYHLPGMKYYERTRPEDFFCTEEQALRAGYRRSQE